MARRIRWMGWVLALLLGGAGAAAGGPPAISEETQLCLDCHISVMPGIYADWSQSRMARTTPRAAQAVPASRRRVSFETLPDALADVAVGCAECHTRNPDVHADTFDHNGFRVHTVVTPGDCAACHPVEEGEFAGNLMAFAHTNLMDNPVYRLLEEAVNGGQVVEGGELKTLAPHPAAREDSCLYCHGTRVEARGMELRETPLGEMEFPALAGWPNQGVGRINPDRTRGSCAACHPRHRFAIETARKPETCAECHQGPDVPAYKVYQVSKHGNIYSAQGETWDFGAVPWEVGTDFSAPTCAACHVSRLTDAEGEVRAERTHRMNDRLSWRLFGLIYAHPQPVSPDTTVIRNSAGLSLPTDFDGRPAAAFLIGKGEQEKRRQTMEAVCRSCHGGGWVAGQFARLDQSILAANDATRTATRIIENAWDKGIATGVAGGGNPFDEPLERKWIAQWLFYANSVRFASAMMGADYGVFDHGRWDLTRNAAEMHKAFTGALKGDRNRPPQPKYSPGR